MMEPANRTPDYPPRALALEKKVWASMGRKDVRQATVECQDLNRRYPDFAPGWHTASHLALRVGRPEQALAAIDRAISIEGERTPWLLQRGLCLSRLGRIKPLPGLVDRLTSRTMETPYQCSALAMLLTRLGRREQAVGLYERAAELQPDEARHYYNAACLQRSLGEIEAAEHNFDRSLRLNPTDYEAYKVRSELRRQTPDSNHVAALEQLLEKGISDPRGVTHICYALAKELEDLGETERSFRYLKTGADTRRSHMQYNVERDLDTMAVIRETFTEQSLRSAPEGHGSSEPIFILGLPRTGTTLVERILDSHSRVFAAGELTNFALEMMALLKDQLGNRQPDRDELVRRSAQLDFRALGKRYIDSTRPFTGHSDRFIDKLPLNYLYVGLIHLALPNATIINLRRDPLDTCYAIYKQLFVDAYPFSYDLEELGRYYVAYHRLMEHWNAVLPGVIHTVQYETLVGDFENEARAVVEACGLEWEPQCLRFYENRTASTTASTVQVRQPVYQSSVGRWRKYADQLAPLIRVLEAAKIPLETPTAVR